MSESRALLRKVGMGALAAAGGSAAAGGLSWLSASTYFARKVLTPDRRRPDDTTVVAVKEDSVVLDATVDTVVPGRYGLWLDGGAGHARLGEVVDTGPGRVERELLGVDMGRLRPDTTARWNAYYYGMGPERSLDLPTEHVEVPTELGQMAAWCIPPDGRSTGEWAVLVHGRGARREETLRAIPALRRSGLTVLVPSYRNDEGAPAGPDGRYNLGLSEWRDIESAVLYAVTHGARGVVLGGWSMGGAIVLQFLDRSWLSSSVRRVFLNGAVLDWGYVLDHHARLHRVPRPVSALASTMMSGSWGRRLVGIREAIDVAQTDWVTRAEELHHPLLLLHSADDEFVPVEPARLLALARPDLVTFEEWTQARHCKEWNVDPERWERALTDFVDAVDPGPIVGRRLRTPAPIAPPGLGAGVEPPRTDR